MRITLNMRNNLMKTNLLNSANGLLESQDRASSGKRIDRPSDDIPGTGRAMLLRSVNADIDQYSRNCDVAKANLSGLSASLDTVVGQVQDVRRLAVQAANSALTDEARSAIAAQLDQISTELVSTGNSQHLGKYTFSGSLSNVKPMVVNAPGVPPYNYIGNHDQFNVQIGTGVSVQTNVTGDMVFNMNDAAVPATPDLFATIKTLRDRVMSGQETSISSSIEDIDANLNNVIAIRSQVGARISRVDSMKNMLSDSKLQVQDLLSKTEDVDLVEAIVDLQTKQNVYQAAIATANKVMQQTLADYM